LIKEEHKGSGTHDIQFIYALQKMNVLQSLKAKLDKTIKILLEKEKKALKFRGCGSMLAGPRV